MARQHPWRPALRPGRRPGTFKEALEKVTIDVSRAHIWDISSVAALDMIILKFRREGAEVEIIGLSAPGFEPAWTRNGTRKAADFKALAGRRHTAPEAGLLAAGVP
jgi:MFS superfamily sulfate permease-like transporter